MTKILLAVSGNAVLTNAAIVAVLVAVLVGFSDPASAEDEVCSKLFKSNYLREVCSELRPKTDRRSDLERYVRKSCGILKIGHENPSPSFPRSSKVIADAERAVQECINQYPDHLVVLKRRPPEQLAKNPRTSLKPKASLMALALIAELCATPLLHPAWVWNVSG